MLHFHQIADPDELRLAAEIVRQSHEQSARELALTPDRYPDHPAFITPDRITVCAAHPEHHLYGIYRKTTMIGAFCFSTEQTGSIHLRFLCLHPDCQHLGYGEKVLRYLIDLVRPAGVGRLTVILPAADITTADWYARHGFSADTAAGTAPDTACLVRILGPGVDTFA